MLVLEPSVSCSSVNRRRDHPEEDDCVVPFRPESSSPPAARSPACSMAMTAREILDPIFSRFWSIWIVRWVASFRIRLFRRSQTIGDSLPVFAAKVYAARRCFKVEDCEEGLIRLAIAPVRFAAYLVPRLGGTSKL